MTNLIDTTEMYLRTILELEEEGIPALRARIAERLSHSGPTVSQTVARMERDGLLRVEADRSLCLSAQGRQAAVRVMRKHRLAERLLIEVIGLEYEFVHDEACRWEHVMSERVERKIVALLGAHSESPYGNPIPGLEELGVEPDEANMRFRGLPLSELSEGSHTVIVRHLGEPLQKDTSMLSNLREHGVVPGEVVQVTRQEHTFSVHGPRHESAVSVPGDLAPLFFVSLPR